MKRVGGLWDKFCALSNAIEAITNGTINKRNDYVVRRKLCYDAKDSLHRTGLCPEKVNKCAASLVKIVSDGWDPSPMRTMVIRPPRGKERNIMCPMLVDHFVHWMLIQTIRPSLMRGMYTHSYGSIPGRGIDGARRAVERWVQHDPSAKYFVKLDIRKFYESINQSILKAQFRRIIKDERILTVIDKTIEMVPNGIPIGAYPSQWLGNYYLQPLDHFILQKLYKSRRGKRINFIRHYLRYMDDLLLIGSSKRDLEKSVRAIIAFCRETLLLQIKPAWEIKTIAEKKVDDQGKKINIPHVAPIDICGYRFYKDHTEVRSSIFLHTSRLAAKVAKSLEIDRSVLLFHAQGLVSLCGWFSHSDSEYFLRHYINAKVNVNFLKEVISYADKNRVIGDAARIYCQQRGRDGGYQILYGCSGGRPRRKGGLYRDFMDSNLPVDFLIAGED